MIKGKFINYHTKNSVNSNEDKLDLVPSDICGPFNVKSFDGTRYFATFIDDYTRYTRTVIYIFDEFKKYKKFVEKETRCFIKKIRIDNAKEYTIVDMARCMLIQSKLPKSLWGRSYKHGSFYTKSVPIQETN